LEAGDDLDDGRSAKRFWRKEISRNIWAQLLENMSDVIFVLARRLLYRETGPTIILWNSAAVCPLAEVAFPNSFTVLKWNNWMTSSEVSLNGL
jgi:hypothetical protein